MTSTTRKKPKRRPLTREELAAVLQALGPHLLTATRAVLGGATTTDARAALAAAARVLEPYRT